VATQVRLRLAAAFVLAIAVTPLFGQVSVLGASGLLPDLYMDPPHDMQIAETPGGLLKLRFGTIVWNVGDGPLEVRARDRSGNAMTDVDQIVHRSNGTKRARPSTASVFYSGDGHDHWHIGRFVVVTLGRIPGAPPTDPPIRRNLRKIGFCLVDSFRAPAGELRPPNSPAQGQYFSCGFQESTNIRMGISVGYGDIYTAFTAHQSVDVTSVPAGSYRLCVTVNANQAWREKGANVANNSYWYDLELDPQIRSVEVIAGGQSACDTPPPP
jgi:hypothetical protein